MRSLCIAHVFHMLGEMIAEAGHFTRAVYQIQLAILNAKVNSQILPKDEKSWANIELDLTQLLFGH